MQNNNKVMQSDVKQSDSRCANLSAVEKCRAIAARSGTVILIAMVGAYSASGACSGAPKMIAKFLGDSGVITGPIWELYKNANSNTEMILKYIVTGIAATGIFFGIAPLFYLGAKNELALTLKRFKYIFSKEVQHSCRSKLGKTLDTLITFFFAPLIGGCVGVLFERGLILVFGANNLSYDLRIFYKSIGMVLVGTSIVGAIKMQLFQQVTNMFSSWSSICCIKSKDNIFKILQQQAEFGLNDREASETIKKVFAVLKLPIRSDNKKIMATFSEPKKLCQVLEVLQHNLIPTKCSTSKNIIANILFIAELIFCYYATAGYDVLGNQTIENPNNSNQIASIFNYIFAWVGHLGYTLLWSFSLNNILHKILAKDSFLDTFRNHTLGQITLKLLTLIISFLYALLLPSVSVMPVTDEITAFLSCFAVSLFALTRLLRQYGFLPQDPHVPLLAIISGIEKTASSTHDVQVRKKIDELRNITFFRSEKPNNSLQGVIIDKAKDAIKEEIMEKPSKKCCCGRCTIF
jgi:hypothetical protein